MKTLKWLKVVIVVTLICSFVFPNHGQAATGSSCGTGAAIAIGYYGSSTWQLVVNETVPATNRPSSVSVSDGTHTTTQTLVWKKWSGGGKYLAPLNALSAIKKVGTFGASCSLLPSTGWTISGQTFIR